ncbi:hypothetical protein EDB83DRAFT_2396438, partial [Lactarius deliciosus]
RRQFFFVLFLLSYRGRYVSDVPAGGVSSSLVGVARGKLSRWPTVLFLVFFEWRRAMVSCQQASAHRARVGASDIG